MVVQGRGSQEMVGLLASVMAPVTGIVLQMVGWVVRVTAPPVGLTVDLVVVEHDQGRGMVRVVVVVGIMEVKRVITVPVITTIMLVVVVHTITVPVKSTRGPAPR
jgi:hypothetical protein